LSEKVIKPNAVSGLYKGMNASRAIDNIYSFINPIKGRLNFIGTGSGRVLAFHTQPNATGQML